MSNRKEILERLAKLKALAEGGVGGERENAARLLEEIAARYGVPLESLDDEAENAESDHEVEFSRGWKANLLAQILGLMRFEQYGDVKAAHLRLFTRSRGGRVVGAFVRCTEAQWLEAMAKFTVLSRDYKSQLDAFFRAFLEANDLLLPYGVLGGNPSDKEKEAAAIASRLANGIKKSALRRQIEGRRLIEGGMA